MFNGKSQNSSFLTMLKVKIHEIEPKRKNGFPNFLYVVKLVKIYLKIDKNFEKMLGAS
jgi:hypothetical protein